MMNYPPIDELIEKAGSRYALVTAVAKRARGMMEVKEESDGDKPVSEAVMELYEGKLIIKNDVDSGYSE